MKQFIGGLAALVLVGIVVLPVSILVFEKTRAQPEPPQTNHKVLLEPAQDARPAQRERLAYQAILALSNQIRTSREHLKTVLGQADREELRARVTAPVAKLLRKVADTGASARNSCSAAGVEFNRYAERSWEYQLNSHATNRNKREDMRQLFEEYMKECRELINQAASVN